MQRVNIQEVPRSALNAKIFPDSGNVTALTELIRT